jgi:hypothetical protein
MEVFQSRLPHRGVTNGARGHKKIVHAAGTTVFVIAHGYLKFHTVFLSREEAITCMEGLLESTKENARRHIPFDTLLAWNFSRTFPTRVARRRNVTPA